MGGWLKVESRNENSHHPDHPGQSKVHDFSVVEFVNTDFIFLLREEKYNFGEKSQGSLTPHHHTVIFSNEDKSHGVDGIYKHYAFNQSIDEVLSRIRKLNGDPFAECPDLSEHHVLNDRGEWAGDETYVPLDYVTKPNTTDTFLCMAENKSSSAGVLSNTSFWCPITLPEKEGDDSA